MKAKEIRELTIEELEERLIAEEEAYAKMILAHAVTPLDKPSDITAKRRLVARLTTILHERKKSSK